MFLGRAHRARGARTRSEPRGAPHDRARGVGDVPRSRRRVAFVAPGRGSPPDRARESARHSRPILAPWRRREIPGRDAPRARRAGSRRPLADHARASRRGTRHDRAGTLARAHRPPPVGDPARMAPRAHLGFVSSRSRPPDGGCQETTRGGKKNRHVCCWAPRRTIGRSIEKVFRAAAPTPGLEPSRAPSASSTYPTDPSLSNPPPFVSQAHTSGRLKVASLFSGCGVLDYGLTQAGHEIALQTESDDRARNVLAARFQGICQPRDASMVETLPADVDLLAASVMCAEMEGSWRESWSKDSAAAKLKQVLRLVKSRPVPWVLVEASTALLESDGEGVPIVCDLVSEFERLGYRWAHRTVAAAAFGVPDIRPRVLIVASRHGDPRDVLLTEDAGKMTSFEPPGADTQQAFVFNRRPDGTVRVFSDFVEGFHPGVRPRVRV